MGEHVFGVGALGILFLGGDPRGWRDRSGRGIPDRILRKAGFLKPKLSLAQRTVGSWLKERALGESRIRAVYPGVKCLVHGLTGEPA